MLSLEFQDGRIAKNINRTRTTITTSKYGDIHEDLKSVLKSSISLTSNILPISSNQNDNRIAVQTKQEYNTYFRFIQDASYGNYQKDNMAYNVYRDGNGNKVVENKLNSLDKTNMYILKLNGNLIINKNSCCLEFYREKDSTLIKEQNSMNDETATIYVHPDGSATISSKNNYQYISPEINSSNNHFVQTQ